MEDEFPAIFLLLIAIWLKDDEHVRSFAWHASNMMAILACVFAFCAFVKQFRKKPPQP